MPTGRAVLIVEDESIIAHDIQQILADLGYDAYGIASSAEEAMARAAERRPDIALVDIRIKGKLDGIKTAQLLQESHGVPIVYMTAHADDATIERAARTRPYGYLHKPLRPAELKTVIEIALHNHSEQAPLHARSGDRSRDAMARPRPADAPPPAAGEVRLQLEQILQSPDLDAARRSREFLCFIVEETLAGRAADLTQGAIATRVFGRKDDFDALLDPIVRIQAGRLRRSLERYYLLGGKQDAIRIELPRGAYVPAFSRVDHSRPAVIAPEAAPPAAPDPGDCWPSVVVRPFDGPASEAGFEDVALTLQDELALELGRYREARVLLQRDADRAEPAGQSRFELGGRLRREEGGWVVTARLVDRTTGQQVWGDEYHNRPAPGRWSGTLDDVARVIAARVGAEHGVIVQTLAADYRKRPPAGHYAAILSAHHFFFARELRDFAPAVQALRQAVAEEPESALTWAQLARLYLANHAVELSEVQTPVDEAVTFAYQGVRLDPSSVRVRSILATGLLLKGELRSGREELEQVLRLNSGSVVYLEIVGWLMALCGKWERGVALLRDAMERNPHHMSQAYHGLWADHLRRGEFDDAYRAALECRDPLFFWRSMMRACCLGHLGREGEARAEVAELLREKPTLPERGRILIGRYIKGEDLQERVAEGLRKAGLVLR